MSEWQTENGTGAVTVEATGLYIDGEYLEDTPQITTEGQANE